MQADAAASRPLAKDEVMERKKGLTTPRKRWTTSWRSCTSSAVGLELRGAIDFHLERHRTNFGSGRADLSLEARGKPARPPGPPAQARRRRAGRAGKMDTAARFSTTCTAARHQRLHTPAGGGYAGAGGVRR